MSERPAGDRGAPLSWADECQIEPAVVAALYLEHADELRRFLVGVLRDEHAAADVLQVAFAKLVERGHGVEPGARKSWLFTVAYRESLALRRRQAVERSAMQRLVDKTAAVRRPTDAADARMLQWELVERVREALNALPSEQRQVVQLKVGEQKTFAEIAAELALPLGTVLTRMQLALAKLRRALDNER
jgi:RNA polymerase sigma-70 factor (ECF subfamily)